MPSLPQPTNKGGAPPNVLLTHYDESDRPHKSLLPGGVVSYVLNRPYMPYKKPDIWLTGKFSFQKRFSSI